MTPVALLMASFLVQVPQSYAPTGIYALENNVTNRPEYEVTGVYLLKEEKAAKLLLPKVDPPTPSRSYPTRGNWWTHPGSSRPDLIAHLSSGVHGGYFKREWLDTLSMSQLESLHSDHHDELKTGRTHVHWDVVNNKSVLAPTKTTKAGRWVMQYFCNGRTCGWHRVWVEG